MNTLIVISIIYFMTLVSYRVNKIVREDSMINIYSKDLKMNSDEVIEYIEYYEGYKVYDEIENIRNSKKGLDKTSINKIMKKIEKNKKKINTMRKNKTYKVISVFRYKLASVGKCAFRLLKIASMVFLINSYNLAPVLITMLTGALFWGMVASVIIMVFYSISFERDVIEELVKKHGEESVQDVYFKISLRLTSIFEAIIMQGNMIIFVIVNELL